MIDGPPPHVKFLWLFGRGYGGSEVCLPDSASATQLCSTVPNFTSSLLLLFFVRPLFRNYVINCRALQPLHSYRFLSKFLSPLLNRVKVAAIAWYNVKIRVISGVRFERRKVNKKSKPIWKLKHANSILENFEYLCQLPSKSVIIISSYKYRFKVGSFLRHSVVGNHASSERADIGCRWVFLGFYGTGPSIVTGSVIVIVLVVHSRSRLYDDNKL